MGSYHCARTVEIGFFSSEAKDAQVKDLTEKRTPFLFNMLYETLTHQINLQEPLDQEDPADDADFAESDAKELPGTGMDFAYKSYHKTPLERVHHRAHRVSVSILIGTAIKMLTIQLFFPNRL